MTPDPPHLYTRAEWAAMDRTQRRLIRAHRLRAVEWARAEHERRYGTVCAERRWELYVAAGGV